LRGTKQSRKHHNALYFTGLLRRLAMTDGRDVIGNGDSVPPNSRKWQHTSSSWTCYGNFGIPWWVV